MARSQILGEVQRHTLLDRAKPGFLLEDPDGMRVSWVNVERQGNLITGTLEFRLGERAWTHTFTTRYLDQRELEAALQNNGLHDAIVVTQKRLRDGPP